MLVGDRPVVFVVAIAPRPERLFPLVPDRLGLGRIEVLDGFRPATVGLAGQGADLQEAQRFRPLPQRLPMAAERRERGGIAFDRWRQLLRPQRQDHLVGSLTVMNASPSGR